MNSTAGAKQDAFILTGSFIAICRAPRYLAELHSRGLTVLLATPARWRADAEASLAEPGHPATAADEIAFVAGSPDHEGSFNAGAIAAARDWQRRYRIVGAYAVGETMVEPTGLLADALGLPGPGLRASRVCRSKYLQRWYLPDASPPSTVIPAGGRDTTDLREVSYPAVLKPASRHSSSGVVTVPDESALRVAMAEYPGHETLLAESRVWGQEYSVETLTQDGTILFASVTRKDTNEAGGEAFVELAHSVPADGTAAGQVLAANEAVLRRLDMRDGITHAEWRVDADGVPRLMEVAARTPGDGLCVLYELATGAPLEPVIVDIALGVPTEYPAPRRFTRQVYVEADHGVLDDVRVDWPGITPTWVGEAGQWPEIEPGAADDPATLRAVLVLKERGAWLGPLRSSDDRAVTALIDAPNPAELDELEARVRAAITIAVSAPGTAADEGTKECAA
ncbi:ATP-grasp domain-containing protein [Haloechinothrix halophila]|uniref:ATP-grasp domain-containing protein n=1 Tax=Haloechinothrix halophila TaxID=1069073 RepID=UPI0006844D45|nr:ATP-grasp domain-containing protein [Haloechinothrix halophila]